VTRFAAQPYVSGATDPERRRVNGYYEHLPLPRRVADRLYLAGEAVPPAFGIVESVDVRNTREATG
jgi:pilus assembly protein CpaF